MNQLIDERERTVQIKEMKKKSAPMELGPNKKIDMGEIKLSIRNLNFYYGEKQALFNNTLDIAAKRVTAFIGPSGCGKSTHIRTYNRMFELYKGFKADGEIIMDGQNILTTAIPALHLRRKVGMIFQKPTPFPMSLFDNIAYGLKLHNGFSSSEIEGRVEKALKDAALWEEVQGKLHHQGTALSGGQQQRLCIARALAVEPDVLLMDEPCSALDPIATAKIEELIEELKGKLTIVIVTHNMQQAARVSDFTAYMYMGKLMEFGATSTIFMNPVRKETEDYVTGRFG